MDSIHDVIRFYAKENVKVTPQASFYRRAAIYRVTTEEGSFGVKKFAGSLAELEFVTHFLQHLEQEKYPYSPRLWRTQDGALYQIHESRGYFATTWYGGAGTIDVRDPAQVRAIGTAVAELHQASRSFHHPLPKRNFVGKEAHLVRQKHRAFAGGYRELRKKYADRPFAKLLAEQMPQLLRESENGAEALNGRTMTEYLADPHTQQTVCHRDITTPNLLYDGAHRNLHLIDFDSAGYTLPLVDLDKFLSNCLNWDGRRFKVALAAYHRVEPLTEEARYLLAKLMILPKEEWFLTAQYLAAPLSAVKEQRLTEQLKRVLQAKTAKRHAIDQLIRFRLSQLGREF